MSKNNYIDEFIEKISTEIKKTNLSFGELFGELLEKYPNMFNYEDNRFLFRLSAFIHDKNLDLSNEIWRPIKGYEGLYEVSNKGRIKRLLSTVSFVHPKTNSFTTRTYPEHILSLEMTSLGYRIAHLCKDGKDDRLLINRLVAEAFLDNPNEYPVVNHKDECPWNNTVENLEWCTYSYNNAYNNLNNRRFNTKHENFINKSVKYGNEILHLDKNFNIIESFDNSEDAHRNNNNYDSSGIRRAVRRDNGTYNNDYWIEKWEYEYIKSLVLKEYLNKFLHFFIVKGNIKLKDKDSQIELINRRWNDYKDLYNLRFMEEDDGK